MYISSRQHIPWHLLAQSFHEQLALLLHSCVEKDDDLSFRIVTAGAIIDPCHPPGCSFDLPQLDPIAQMLDLMVYPLPIDQVAGSIIADQIAGPVDPVRVIWA